MAKIAGFSIGFQPTDIVKEYVDVVLNVDDLRIVYPFIENYLEKKEILMIPGPTKVTEEIIKELKKPIIPHRDSRFKNLFNELTSLVKEVFETEKDVILLTGSSTLGMEAAIANVSDSNDNVLVISNGKFGERFAEIASRYANVIHVKRKWGERINLEEIEKLFREYRIKAVTMVHNETSTGMVNPLKEIGELAKKYGALFIVDVVSSVGGDIIEFDKWNIDIAVLGVQKAIGAPPGVTILLVNPDVWKVIERKKRRPPYYMDLLLYKKYAKVGETPFTPAISLVYSLKKALEIIKEEGIRNRVERHKIFADVIRKTGLILGLKPVAEANFSKTVTAFYVPENFTPKEIVEKMKEYGVYITTGQGHFKEKVIRIGHMGNVTVNDILRTVATLDIVLGGRGKATELAFKLLNGYPKIALLANFSEDFKNKLEKIGILTDNIEEAEIVIIRSKNKINKDFLDKARNLKAIITATHGLDHIDFEEVRRRKIEVYEVAVSARSVAELTFALIFALSRKIVEANNALKKGLWKKNEMVGTEIYGKKLGIVGFGRIGKEVARIGKALGMKILVYDPYITTKSFKEHDDLEFVDTLENLLRNSDIITLHIALTPETKGLIGEREFKLMKTSAYLINTSRGKIVDKQALYRALKEEWIAGAALDVFDTEPPQDDQFKDLHNLIVTPHIGACTLEANRRKERRIIELIKEIADNKKCSFSNF